MWLKGKSIDSDLPMRCQLATLSPCPYSSSARIWDRGELGIESAKAQTGEKRGGKREGEG